MKVDDHAPHHHPTRPPGHWSAWFADNPGHAFGGDHPAVAVARLLEASAIDSATIAADYEANRDGHMEFTVPSGEPCLECGGSSMYVGLNTVEVCRACAGHG